MYPTRFVYYSTKEETAELLRQANAIRAIREELENELGLSDKNWNPLLGRYEDGDSISNF